MARVGAGLAEALGDAEPRERLNEALHQTKARLGSRRPEMFEYHETMTSLRWYQVKGEREGRTRNPEPYQALSLFYPLPGVKGDFEGRAWISGAPSSESNAKPAQVRVQNAGLKKRSKTSST